jgi:hypothetical protein
MVRADEARIAKYGNMTDGMRDIIQNDIHLLIDRELEEIAAAKVSVSDREKVYKRDPSKKTRDMMAAVDMKLKAKNNGFSSITNTINVNNYRQLSLPEQLAMLNDMVKKSTAEGVEMGYVAAKDIEAKVVDIKKTDDE